jgi:glyoxylase-like metal-dependent hydrolase (beta-lactamase superfamily II)
MPHGSARVGEVEIIALCDGVLESSEPIEESFLGATQDTWDDAAERYPETVAPSGHWRLHVHCFALRSEGRTIVVDTGFGPVTAPAFAWANQAGRLPVELAEAGIEAGEVDTVIITHVHDDHLGWTVFDGGRTLHFPNARYVFQREDWDWMAASEDPEDVEIFAHLMKPIADLGALQLSQERLDITGELRALHAPGHTPGHQVVFVDSRGERAIVSGDTANHPLQVTAPTIVTGTDADPELAVRTRIDLLDRVEREDRLLITGHFPEPFGRITNAGDSRTFSPA